MTYFKIFVLCLFPLTVFSGNYKPLSEILKENKAEVKVVGSGGHTGYCVEITVKNISVDTLLFYLEPGRRLDSQDSTMQDIFIVKEEKVELNAGESRTFNGFGFCCQSSNHSPSKDARFGIGIMAPPEWVGLANLLNKSNLEASVMQTAVWIFSDDHPVASLPSGSTPALDSLRQYISLVKKIEFPWYNLDYLMDSSVFSGKPAKLSGKLKFALKHNAIVSVVVRYKQNGLLMETILEGKGYSRGNYELPIFMDVKKWPKGNYEISVYTDYNNLLRKESFVLQ